MDISQWEVGSIVSLHRSCRAEWHSYPVELAQKEDSESEQLATIEINAHGVYSKMK